MNMEKIGKVVVTGEETHAQNYPEASCGEHNTVDIWRTTKSVAIQKPATSRSKDDCLNRRRRDSVILSLDCACDGGKCV